jgi:N-acetylneuraminate synthase
MNKAFSSKPLFVFELANNHSGSAEHGLAIIRAVHAAVETFKAHFDFGFKLQYRHLDTFIHPDYKERQDIKYVKRFLETRLNPDQMNRLKDEMAALGFLAICTPFDERSVDLIEAHGFDVIKIASCSFTDWPLLERVVKAKKPIIASAAGVPLEDIDNVVSFLTHRNKDFGLMHCVAEYPTENRDLQLNQIDLFRTRYPNARIGYSTHEHPDNCDSIRIAVGKGAKIFEKHVGLASASVKLNEYSATPEQVGRWLEAARDAFDMCGAGQGRARFGEKEIDSLISLRRGAFARRKINPGEKIGLADVFLAIPTVKDQITANDLSKYTLLTASVDIEKNQPILGTQVDRVETREKVRAILDKIKVILHKSKVVVPQQLEFEISHHYGIDRFAETGCTIITYLNREYCKKLIVVLPGQSHPEQYHKLKEETFIVSYGDVQISVDGVERECKRGDIVTIERGMKHVFASRTGAVIEEISSTHFKDDSYYTDPAVVGNPNRKTQLTYWLD